MLMKKRNARQRAREHLAEQTAQDSEDRFRAVFESSNDAIFLLTEDGFFDCNPRALEIFGIESRDIVATLHPGLISPPLQPDGTPSMEAATKHIRHAFAEGVDNFEWVHRRLTGEDFPADVLLSAFDFRGRRVLQATVRDITAQKNAETALLEKTELFDRFFNLALDLLCIADTDGRFLHLNRAWESTLGYTLDELEGRNFIELIHPDDVQPTIDAIAMLSDQRSVIDFINRYRCKDGSYRWIEWRSAPSGNLIYAAARDITSHIEAQAALLELNETLDRRVNERTRQLQESEAELLVLNAELEQRVQERTASLEATYRELESFSYSVSHDLRAPLRHIGGFVELLQSQARDALEEKHQRWLGHVVNAVKDMGQLIDDLLVFSRMGRSEMLHTDCDLGGIIHEIIQDITTDAPDRTVEWIVPELPTVHGDPSMLRLAFTNLLGNAFKYTRPRDPARVEMSCDVVGNEYVLSIQDNGVGFDMRYADKLFGVFQRLHSAKEYEGTGIGLANVQRIVHRHGGRVWAEGAVDEGATFHVSLPRYG